MWIKKLFVLLFCQSSTLYSHLDLLTTSEEPMRTLRPPARAADHLCRGPGAKEVGMHSHPFFPLLCPLHTFPCAVLIVSYNTALRLLGRHFYSHSVDRKTDSEGLRDFPEVISKWWTQG